MSSKNKTQDKVNVIIGPVANRPVAANVQPGTISYTSDAPPSIDIADATTGVRTWQPLSGSGGNSALPKYWVSPPGLNPVAAFTDVQSAINAAVLDGHSASARVEVLVNPGFYGTGSGQLVLKDGIDIVGLGVPFDKDIAPTSLFQAGDVVILDPVVLDPSFTKCGIVGIWLNQGVDLGTNASVTNLELTRSRVQSSNAGAFTFTGAPTTTPQVVLEETQIVGAAPTSKGLGFSTAVNLTMKRSSIALNSKAQVALSRAGGTLIAEDTAINGSILYTALSASETYRRCDLTLNGVSAIAFGATGSTVSWTGGSILGAVAGTSFSGTGTINLVDVVTDANAFTIPSTVTANTSGILRGFIEQKVCAANKTITNVDADLYLFDTTASGRTCNLPVLATVPKGTVVRVGMQISGANPITVSPNGGELINGTAATFVTSTTLLGSAQVVAGSTSWWVLVRS